MEMTDKDRKNQIVDATCLGIIYHPQLRDKMTEEVRKDICHMVRDLAEQLQILYNQKKESG